MNDLIGEYTTDVTLTTEDNLRACCNIDFEMDQVIYKTLKPYIILLEYEKAG